MEQKWCVGVLENDKMIILWCMDKIIKLLIFLNKCASVLMHTHMLSYFCGMCDKVVWVITNDQKIKCELKHMITWFMEGFRIKMDKWYACISIYPFWKFNQVGMIKNWCIAMQVIMITWSSEVRGF